MKVSSGTKRIEDEIISHMKELEFLDGTGTYR
jgi:hypothetical protein